MRISEIIRNTHVEDCSECEKNSAFLFEIGGGQVLLCKKCLRLLKDFLIGIFEDIDEKTELRED